MNPKTEQIFASLEILVERLPFDLPYHEDGGHVYPFVWNTQVQSEFNIFNLCRSNGWIKLTDAPLVIKQWQGLEYTKAFNDEEHEEINEFFLNDENIHAWQDGIRSLAQSIDRLDNIQAYDFQFRSDVSPNGIILGRDNDGNWIGVTSTVYLSGVIPKATLDFNRDPQSELDTTADRSEIITQITSNIASSKNIQLDGDFGGGYPYSYNHKIVYGIGATRELAWKSTIQASGMLSRGKFNNIYQKDSDLLERYYDYAAEKIDNVFGRYLSIVKLFKQELIESTVYRISSWNSENIYIIGEPKQGNQGDRVGIYIKSNFVYNP
jgi:hypothetical protein